jgi:hypothetical protein
MGFAFRLLEHAKKLYIIDNLNAVLGAMRDYLTASKMTVARAQDLRLARHCQEDNRIVVRVGRDHGRHGI